MPEPALELTGLGADHGDLRILDALDLAVTPGEFIAVLGASGSGKSTLLRVLAGLMPAARGSLRLDGQAAIADGRERIPAEVRKVGMVFQDYALFPTLTVAQNIGFGLQRPDPDRVRELLHMTGLHGLGDRLPAELSGGQQQRVAIARALAPRPRVLLLDEPFANIDVSHRQDLGAELATLVRREGATVLLVTHDHQEALLLADRVAVLVPGSGGARLAQVDHPEAVWSEPASLEVARLFGPVNQLTGEGGRRFGEQPAVGTVLGDLPCRRPDHGTLNVLIRPDQLFFEAAENGPARVLSAGYLGGRWRVRCLIEDQELLAMTTGARPPEGSRGHLKVTAPVWTLPRQG